jgi:hypothetical protein
LRHIGQYDFFKNHSDEDYHFLEVCNDLKIYDKDYVVDIAFNYFRRNGFPHYKIQKGEKISQMDKLISFNHLSLLDGDKINQSMHSLRLAWSYFPHFWGVRCGSSKHTPLDVFSNDNLFKKTLEQTYKYCLKYENGIMRMNRIRQSLKVYNGVQVVSNFRPTASKLIYELFGGGGVVWDMSCGWGGRLLGALSSFKIKKYIGTEPSTKTYDGLIKMKEDFKYLKKKVDIHCMGSEDFIPCKNSLKKNGFLVLNIANTSSAKKIEEGLLLLSKNIGFKYVKTMQLVLSAINGGGYKYEPIYVFKKDLEDAE